MKKKNIPELELKILNVLWSRDVALKVQEVLDIWPEKNVPGYTTILKKLQIMEKKELVTHTKSGRSYSYFPLVKKDKVTESKFKKILTDLFKGNKIEMAAAFVKDTDLSENELSELIDMLKKERDKC